MRRLIQLASTKAPEIENLIDESDRLTAHGVASRYPDDWAIIESEEMERMVTLARKIGAAIVSRLNL